MAIYINTELSITNVSYFSTPNFEGILLNAAKNNINFQILGIYKPPKTTYRQLINYLQQIKPLVNTNQQY